MGKDTPKYAEAYKAEAVELGINSGRPVAEIARELGVDEGTLTGYPRSARRAA